MKLGRGLKFDACARYVFVRARPFSAVLAPKQCAMCLTLVVSFQVPSPPEIRAAKGMAVAVFNDALYVIGGHSGLSYFRDVFCFDGKEWVAAPPLPSTRSVSAAVSY